VQLAGVPVARLQGGRCYDLISLQVISQVTRRRPATSTALAFITGATVPGTNIFAIAISHSRPSARPPAGQINRDFTRRQGFKCAPTAYGTGPHQFKSSECVLSPTVIDCGTQLLRHSLPGAVFRAEGFQ